MILSPKQKAELKLLLQEQKRREIDKKKTKGSIIREYIQKYLWILNTDSQLVLLQLNKTQDYVLTIIEKLWKAGIPVRLIILKARQEGISTLIEAIGFLQTILNKGTKMKVISYDDKSAKGIYEMSERFYRNLPVTMQPATKYYTKSSLVFREMESQITVDTAKKLEAARSETVQILHISEMALMDYVKELLASLRNSVPKDNPNSMVIIESTAKGMGNDFQLQYEKGSTLEEVLSGQNVSKGKSDYVKIFIPWFWLDRYTMKPPDDFKLVDYEHPAYGNETEIKKTYGLTLPQMMWRRHTILNECDGDLDIFKQEYPANDLEAFIASGRSRFSKLALQNYMMKVCPPLAIGDLKIVETAKQAREHYGGSRPTIEFVKDPVGNLKIWEFPIKETNYVFGVDVSEGILVDKYDNRKSDWSVVSVWRRDIYKKVAQWRGKIDPDLLGNIAYAIGHFYNYGWIGVEDNWHGLTTLKNLQKRYSRLYYKIILDEKTNEKTRKLGWHTDHTVKGYLIDCLASIVREEIAIIYSEETIREYLTYIEWPDGRLAAQSGKHDDIVMADAIALQVHKQMPWVRFETKPESTRDWSYAGT